MLKCDEVKISEYYWETSNISWSMTTWRAAPLSYNCGGIIGIDLTEWELFSATEIYISVRPGSRFRTHPPVRHVTVPFHDIIKSLMDCILNKCVDWLCSPRQIP